MHVYVKLFASLTKSVPGLRAGTPLKVDLPEESTLADLVAHFALPEKQVKITFVNGRIQTLDYCLTCGDEVGIFPPVGGG